MHTDAYDTRDELRARFTVWLVKTVSRARRKYLSKESLRIQTISIETLSENCLQFHDDLFSHMSGNNRFDFEEERLAKAFANLPVKRQQILTMLFVEEKKPAEIAQILHCSEQYVYDQRYQALKKLRIALSKLEDRYDV